MSNSSQITSPRLAIMLAGIGILLIGSLLLLTQGVRAAGGNPVLSTIASTTSDTGATITWTTDDPSSSQVYYGPSNGNYNAASTLDTTLVTNHTAFLGGLAPNTTYHFVVVSTGSTTTATSSDMTFMTTAANTASTTTTANASSTPVLSAIVATPTDTGATITWTSDVSSNSQVLYGLTSSYGNMSPIDFASTTAHTITLSGLTPSTLYHFQAWSGNGTNNASSTDMTFTTLAASTTTNTGSTTAPVLTNVAASTTDTTATVTWTSAPAAGSQVFYGLTNAYGNSSTLDSTNVTNHSVLLIGLAPNTTYHFMVQSGTATSMLGTSTDMTFTTGSTTTSTGSTTLDSLQAQIDALKARVSALEAFIAGLGGNMGGGTTTPPTGGNTGTIDQNGATVNAGGSIDLVGRNFGHEENVVITLNGSQVAVAHADGGGNFSTGSIPAPTTPGSYTYQFTGQTSGITGSAHITVK